MAIDRHNCFAATCKASGVEMENAIKAWLSGIQGMILEVPRSVDASVKITDVEVQAWIDADKAKYQHQIKSLFNMPPSMYYTTRVLVRKI